MVGGPLSGRSKGSDFSCKEGERTTVVSVTNPDPTPQSQKGENTGVFIQGSKGSGTLLLTFFLGTLSSR